MLPSRRWSRNSLDIELQIKLSDTFSLYDESISRPADASEMMINDFTSSKKVRGQIWIDQGQTTLCSLRPTIVFSGSPG